MLSVGRALVEAAAPGAAAQFGYHLPPFNSVDHLHLHCFALPFVPRWKSLKYTSAAGCHLWYLPAEALLQVRARRVALIAPRLLLAHHARLTAPRGWGRQRLGAARGGAAGGAYGYGALDDKSVP